MPPPEPRSNTVSPGFSITRAVGFPQPSDAFTASSGICAVWVSLYRSEVIGSPLESQAEVPQQKLPPLRTRRAASPYFSFTASLIFLLISLSYLQHTMFLGSTT